MFKLDFGSLTLITIIAKLITMNKTRTLIILFVLIASSLFSQKLLPGPQVQTFFSDADDTEQPYGLYVPKNYDPNKKYPLVIMLHGAGSNHRLSLRRVFGKSNANNENDVEATRYFPEWADVDYIVASPYARGTMGYQGVAEKDVWDVLADVKKKFNIDEDRTYLTGLSMGGGGTLWIGLTRPDVWAAIAPVCPAPPAGSEIYQGNALNVPVHFFHGDNDQAVNVNVSRVWVENLKKSGANVTYQEYPGVGHDSWVNAYKDEFIFTWFKQFKRNPFPDRVRFATAQYKYNKAYWVELDQITPGTPASIDAKFSGPNQLEITTSAVTGFTLSLKGHPQYKAAEPYTIVINGGKKMKVPASEYLSFKQEGGKWSNGKAIAQGKKPGAEGPIGAVFSERHVYVFGTGGASQDEINKRRELAEQAANWSMYRNAFLGRVMFFPRVVSDKEIRPSDTALKQVTLCCSERRKQMRSLPSMQTNFRFIWRIRLLLITDCSMFIQLMDAMWQLVLACHGGQDNRHKDSDLCRQLRYDLWTLKIL